MKNAAILVPITLLICGLGVWSLTALGKSGTEVPSVLDHDGSGSTGTMGLPAGKSQVEQPQLSKTVRKPKAGLSFGPTWNRKNPWFKTQGIGRSTSPPAKGAVIFPDGTWLPVLNGVENAPRFPGFNPGYPYAPVVRITTSDDGTQWYHHADGTRSSPQNMTYGEGGETLGTRPGWAVGNPYEKKPVVGPDGRTRYEPRESGKPKVRTGPGG